MGGGRRGDVVRELLTTESHYVADLGVIVDEFVGPVRARELLSREEQQELFSNVVQVREFHVEFLGELQRAFDKDGAEMDAGALFLARMQMFKIYATHCSNMSVLHDLVESFSAEKPAFREFLGQMIRSKQCRMLPLESFLVAPMQRITKYPLLLRELAATYDPGDSRHAAVCSSLEEIRVVVDLLNERTRQVEMVYGLRAVQRRLRFAQGCAVPDELRDVVSMNRRVVREVSVEGVGSDSILGKKRMQFQTWVLFNDLLLVGERDDAPPALQSSARGGVARAVAQAPIDVRVIVPISQLNMVESVRDESSGPRQHMFSLVEGPQRVRFFTVQFQAENLALLFLEDLRKLGVQQVKGSSRGELKKTLSQKNLQNVIQLRRDDDAPTGRGRSSTSSARVGAPAPIPTAAAREPSPVPALALKKPDVAVQRQLECLRTGAAHEVRFFELKTSEMLKKLYDTSGSAEYDRSLAESAQLLKNILLAVSSVS